jgi:predicted nuclease of predicted toxin-antitoxin system
VRGLLLDENLPPAYRTYLGQRHPNVLVREIGDRNAPPDGTLDPEVLRWCEANEFVLITNNRASMPAQLAAHLAAGNSMPGIFTVNLNAPIHIVMEDALTVAFASNEADFRDLIIFLPL